MKLPLLIVILLIQYSHFLQAFSLSSRFLLHSTHVDDEVVMIDKRGGVVANGHASAHGGSSGGRASHGRGTAGRNIPVYAGDMNHHNFNKHRNVGTTLNSLCFSSLFFIICSILIMMV
ncbi:hypothetical protein RND71_013253 [Anisodus tanguticus]|uniref:Uncharacterized protein n=1 Tax=Anisodus tanguticus TaxID=243964 RepID=A0AAE1VMH6_9SOLA|nr:hypothetical protein RND71_013253 [Anisodus tanguticus]